MGNVGGPHSSNVCTGHKNNPMGPLQPPHLPQTSAVQNLPITFKELFPIVLAFKIWGPNFSNKCIVLHSDNYAVVHILNKQTSKDTAIMSLVRKFVILCMRYNILTKAEHIPGSRNILPDLLSRFQIRDFKNRAPQMNTELTKVPDSVLDDLCTL